MAKIKELAGSILELSGCIGVDRNRLSALRHRDDAPMERKDCKYDVEEWREYIQLLNPPEDGDPHGDEEKRLKRENLRLKNALARFELLKRQGNLLTISEHLLDVRELMEHCKWLVSAIPTRVALLTTDESIRTSIRSLCEQVAKEFAARLDSEEERAKKAEQDSEEIQADFSPEV